MKPSWNDAPEWANYLAMDADGQWYWYSGKPNASIERDMFSSKAGICELAKTNKWHESLEKRPSK